MVIAPGVAFDTLFEQGCVATSEVASDSTFSAFDSEGVECRFVTAMVVGHPDFYDPTK